MNFIQEQVRIKDITSKYDVDLRIVEYTGWVKIMNFVDKEKRHYKGRLSWSVQNGYLMDWDGVPPSDLLDLSTRPEFEYIVDCITEGDDDETDTIR
jgi:hypothetical protein